MRSVRTERYKYIRRFGDRLRPAPANAAPCPSRRAWEAAGWLDQPLPREALYDLVLDPGEGANLAADPSRQAVLAAMRADDVATDQTQVVYRIPPSVVIGSPLHGAVLRVERVRVEGFVDDATTLVDVNGVVAVVDAAGRFVAEDVPLDLGVNAVRARAVDGTGATGTDEIEVTRTDEGMGRLRMVLVIPGRSMRDVESTNLERVALAVEGLQEFRDALSDLGYSAERFWPDVESPVAAAPEIGLHLFVFSEAGTVGEPVWLPGLSELFPEAPDVALLQPMGDLGLELMQPDVAPALRSALVPQDFAPVGFARFSVWRGGPR